MCEQKLFSYVFRTITVLCLILIYIACESGTFGRECRELCGKCKGNYTCHHINGTCTEGCIPGYIGLQCDQGTFLWLKKWVHFKLMFSLTMSDAWFFCTLNHCCISEIIFFLIIECYLWGNSSIAIIIFLNGNVEELLLRIPIWIVQQYLFLFLNIIWIACVLK